VPQPTLVPEAAPTSESLRRPIAREYPGLDPVEPELAKRHPEEDVDRFGGISLPAVFQAEPVAHLRPRAGEVELMQPDAAEKRVVGPAYDGERKPFAGASAPTRSRDPVSSVAR